MAWTIWSCPTSPNWRTSWGHESDSKPAVRRYDSRKSWEELDERGLVKTKVLKTELKEPSPILARRQDLAKELGSAADYRTCRKGGHSRSGSAPAGGGIARSVINAGRITLCLRQARGASSRTRAEQHECRRDAHGRGGGGHIGHSRRRGATCTVCRGLDDIGR